MLWWCSQVVLPYNFVAVLPSELRALRRTPSIIPLLTTLPELTLHRPLSSDSRQLRETNCRGLWSFLLAFFLLYVLPALTENMAE